MTQRRRRPGRRSPGPASGPRGGGRPVDFFSDGLRLAGLWYPARGRGRAAPGLIFCHGFTATKELYLPPLAAAFARAGFAVLSFDYRRTVTGRAAGAR